MSIKFPKPENIIIDNVRPSINGGRFPIKREPLDTVLVQADIFRHSHEKITAELLFRKQGKKKWSAIPMEDCGNDLWQASFQVMELGNYEYTVKAWTLDPVDTPQMADSIYEVRVDPTYARYGAWYEMFPRSQGTIPGQSATWDDCANRLDDIKAMGFDTIYLTPIHPIGQTNKKGPNNSLTSTDENPGCPYAIGNTEGGWGDGGSCDLERTLGTWQQFDAFMKKSRDMGFDMALDIALNCSPDHPHVKSNPEWYYHEEDGSIKFAENPPKKYEDIYPYDYFNENWQALWEEIRDMLLFWAGKGFNIFRIDNPHTKPFQFWEWVIAEVKAKHPECVFLAEAFTRPKIMHRLGKLGFDLSYTYFTWRVEKQEIQEYLTELTVEAKDYMRGIFFPTTPDILPWHLQNANREEFMIRFALASTLSSIYGMNNGYELCENEPFPGKEEYWNSEKYDFKVRDWNKEGNIKPFITKINQLRKDNLALQEYDNLRFHQCDNDSILVYSKRDTATGNTVLFVVNLDSQNSQSGWIQLNLNELGLNAPCAYQLHDKLTGETYTWENESGFVILDPKKSVAHAFVIN